VGTEFVARRGDGGEDDAGELFDVLNQIAVELQLPDLSSNALRSGIYMCVVL
jgi:hypothetical protein